MHNTTRTLKYDMPSLREYTLALADRLQYFDYEITGRYDC